MGNAILGDRIYELLAICICPVLDEEEVCAEEETAAYIIINVMVW